MGCHLLPAHSFVLSCTLEAASPIISTFSLLAVDFQIKWGVICLDSVRLFLFNSEVSSSQSPIARTGGVVPHTGYPGAPSAGHFSSYQRGGSKESSGCCIAQLAVTMRNRSFAKLHSYVVDMIQFSRVLATFFQVVFDSMKHFFLLLPKALSGYLLFYS